MWVTLGAFALGFGAGAIVLRGGPRRFAGDDSLDAPAAIITAVLATTAFVISSLVHRRREAIGMPVWQRVVARLSGVALGIALAGVSALGVLLTSQILAVGLEGAEVPPLGAGLLIGAAAAVAARFAYGAGVGLRTIDLAHLLLAFLVIGTLFAMITAADPRWWEVHFSTLGTGAGAWAFNGTLVVAGLLVAAVGAYIGRDLHRILGDAQLRRIGGVVVLWAAAGLALTAVGLVPVDRAEALHDAIAIAAIALFVVAALVTTIAVPDRPVALVAMSVATIALAALAFPIGDTWGLRPLTAYEALVVGLALVWLLTLVRALAAITPPEPRVSARRSLRRLRG